MSRADWRASDAYEDLRSLDAPGFAWEFLRRNPEFERQRRQLDQAARDGVLDQAELDAFAHRWGVRSRYAWRDDRPAQGSVDGTRPAKRGRPDGTSD